MDHVTLHPVEKVGRAPGMTWLRIPSALRALCRWVVWRAEERDGRSTKVPYMATRPTVRAKVNDSATWGAFADAVATVEAGSVTGIGVMLGAGLVGVDLDRVRAERTGLVDADAMTIVCTIDSYTEVSPSGTGVHVLAWGSLPPGGRRRGSLEMYDGGRFFTVTGRHVVGTPWAIEPRTEALAAVHARHLGAPAKKTAPVFSPTPPTPCTSAPRYVTDAALVARAHAARNGCKFAALWRGDTSRYPSHSEADLALCSMLAFWTRGDVGRIDGLFRASGLMRPKWDARRGGQTYGAETIASALTGWR
jgi:primase-polymerase (primpol)-like protein